MHLIHSSNTRPGVARPGVRDTIESISESDLRGWVERISVPRHFIAQPQANRAIADFISATLKGLGYDASFQGSMRNVVAWPNEKHCPDSATLVLVGAHYDSTPGTPGADDNASAVAAMLGCAKAIAQFAPQTPVCFVAFNCEEDGFKGSEQFVAGLAGTGRKIRLAHILEMVGYASSAPGSQRLPTGLPIRIPDRGDFLGLLANNKSGREMKLILGQARAFLPEFPVIGLEVLLGAERLLPVLARSDHVPFWEQNIPAVMWTDTSEFRNRHYHQASDTPDTLDYPFLRRVTQVLTASVLGGGPEHT